MNFVKRHKKLVEDMNMQTINRNTIYGVWKQKSTWSVSTLSISAGVVTMISQGP